MPEDTLNRRTLVEPIPPDHQLPPGDDSRKKPRHSTWVRLLIWLAILLVFGGLFWYVLHHRAAEQSSGGGGRRGATTGPVAITTTTAQKGSIGVYLDAIGTVTPIYTSQVTSQVTGLISEVHYREGQLVNKGDPLIDIDARPYEAQLVQAQGALERDTNLLAQAKMDADRYQQALAGDGIARQTFEDQQKVVLQDQGTVKVDQGTVQYDQVQVDFCKITAPISGRVGLRLVDPGNVVQANSTTPLVVITQVQPITVVFTIAEDSIGQVQDQMKHGKSLEVTAYDRTNQQKIATGSLETIDNQIDTTTGTLKLRAVFPNKDNALFPNLFVNTRLLVQTLQNQTLVPSSAIQQNGDDSYVYVIQNGAANQKNVKVGVTDAGKTAVQGINPGDEVANSSFEKLQNGVKVNVTAPGATNNSGNQAQPSGSGNSAP